MKTSNIDSIFKKTVNDSVNYYDTEANKAKESIWQQVKTKKKNPIRPLLLRTLAAACFLLIICTTILSISYFQTKNSIQTLIETNNTLKQNFNNTLASNTPVQTNIHLTDTIYKVKKVIVTKPIITKVNIIDTVFVKQIVYVEKEQVPELITVNKSNIVADSSFQKSENNYKKEIFISNNKLIKKEKRKKLQLRFGGGKKNQEPSETMIFTAKL
jgi:hypothetical protein